MSMLDKKVELKEAYIGYIDILVYRIIINCYKLHWF